MKASIMLLPAAVIVGVAAAPGGASRAQTTAMVPSIGQTDILADYIYGYAPVALAATRSLMTAVPDATSSPGRAPVNQLARLTTLATPAQRLIPRPNADTLYTLGWLDLKREPIILHVPDMTSRYYLIPLYDAYSNEFASIGSRTTGSGTGDFAVVGPLWRGPLPGGVAVERAPTDTVWLIGRTLVHGPSDLETAVAATRQFQLVPLSAYPQFLATARYDPPTNLPVTPPNPDFIGAPITNAPGFSKPEFFNLLAATALHNPPPLVQARQADRSVADGLVHEDELTSDIVSEANDEMLAEVTRLQARRNGWSIDLQAGDYGTDYLNRAATARFGLGANIAADAVYPSTAEDGDGQPLVGTKSYVIHFPAGQTPPARGFWSLTVYDDNGFLVANPIDRYTVGSETGLVANPDGSLDVLLQNSAPSTGLANWLPTPLAPFNLVLRIYWPEPSVLDGTYVVPPVAAVEEVP